MKTFKQIIDNEATKPYYQDLMDFVAKEYQDKTIFPPHHQIFAALEYCNYEDVKVVIIGQDPYHELNQANGLAFSVNKGIKVPPSLVNIYKELNDDLDIEIPSHGDLTSWAKQGVLLLNNVLTVEEGKANSHAKRGWEIFTLEIVKELNLRKKPLVFILWGKNAIAKEKYIDKHHLVLTSAHPSPLSSYRGFFGSKPFSKTNQFLIKNNIEPIDWSIRDV